MGGLLKKGRGLHGDSAARGGGTNLVRSNCRNSEEGKRVEKSESFIISGSKLEKGKIKVREGPSGLSPTRNRDGHMATENRGGGKGEFNSRDQRAKQRLLAQRRRVCGEGDH